MTPFLDMVRTSQRIAGHAGRLVKIKELAAFLRGVSSEEIEIAVSYLSGEIPQGRIGLAYTALIEAQASPATATAGLSIEEVDRRIGSLAAIRGAGSAARRAETLRDLFASATADEQQFLVRLLMGELRQGALAGVMQDAIAAASNTPQVAVRRAAMYAKDLGRVAAAAMQRGLEGLESFQLQLFSPVSPMLAQSAGDVEEALQILPGNVAFEWKMDGARIQVHKLDDEVRVFTRNANEVTAAIPEIIESIRLCPERMLVLDGEAIAFDASARPHPFQITMRRFGRKLDVETARAQLPIRAFFFDCLRLGDESLMASPARERVTRLEQAVPAAQRVPRLVTNSPDEARAFYEAALAAGHEGLMAKSLDSPYEAGNRGASWLKIKRVHTLDLVVLAAEWGHGRRTGKLSNLHLGALDPQSGEYIMLGKTFKGLTDAMLSWQTEAFLARETHRDRMTVYVRPEIVVEVAFSDLQASTRYPGGLALRLARVKRYRPDKPVSEADDMQSLRRIFAAQSGSLESAEGARRSPGTGRAQEV